VAYFTERDAFRAGDITATDLAINYSFSFRALGQDISLFIAPQSAEHLKETVW
jgi:hypothetical protein